MTARWETGYIQMVWWINKHEHSISNGVLCIIALPLSGTFKDHKIGMGFFGGLIFGPGIFLGFTGSWKDFFGSWLLAPFDHPHHLKSRVPPPPPPGQKCCLKKEGKDNSSLIALEDAFTYRKANTFIKILKLQGKWYHGNHFCYLFNNQIVATALLASLIAFLEFS